MLIGCFLFLIFSIGLIYFMERYSNANYYTNESLNILNDK